MISLAIYHTKECVINFAYNGKNVAMSVSSEFTYIFNKSLRKTEF